MSNDARLAYQEAAVRGAQPVRLTILLYEQVVQDLGRAAEAMARPDAELCAREIGHAVAVIGYLQATLKPEAGGAVARNLARFYTMVREKLMEAQVRCSREILDELRRQMLEVREAWLRVEADTSGAGR